MNMSISPDGSDRIFERIPWHGGTAVRILPAPGDSGRAEAESCYKIGCHLASCKVPVPEIYEFNDETRILIVEDLGDTLFFHKVSALVEQGEKNAIFSLYTRVVDMLLHMQAEASCNFDTAWCYDTSLYDMKFAFERECLYFMNEFVAGIADMPSFDRLRNELALLASHVDSLSCGIFMHRDFQSRNIMVTSTGLKMIDFQAARLGPAGYDAASLLFDPYINLWPDLQLPLLEYYCRHAVESHKIPLSDISSAKDEVQYLAILRLMQAIGAYSFLSSVKQRSFFRQYLSPALESLLFMLKKRPDLPELMNVTEKALELEHGVSSYPA